MKALAALAMAVALATAAPARGAAGPVTFSTDRLGNVFAPAEPVRVTIGAPAGPLAWRVDDRQGDAVASGSATIGDQPYQLELPDLGPGYFELALEPAGCTPGCARRMALAVVPEPTGGGGPYGVMTHIGHGWGQGFAPLMPRAGIRHVRDEQYWSRLESRPGRFDFPQPYLDYMATLARLDLQPLLEMTFANPLYDGGTTPTSAEARAAYGRFGAALAARYPSQVAALEVWNEINGSWCDGACPADRVGAYVGLLEAASQALAASAPKVTIVGGATAGIPLPWWRRLAERGGLAHLDVASVHSYREEAEGVEGEIAGLRAIMRAHGGEKPIWVTETGKWGGSPAERRETAGWLIKQLTILRSAGVDRVYWYLAHDYADADGMGLLRAPDSPFGAYAPNPAYVTYATLIRELGDARFVRREATDPRTRLYLFERAGREIRVGWSSAGETELTFSGDAGLSLLTGEGRPAPLAGAEAGWPVTLTAQPLYLIGEATLVKERRPDRLIADSEVETPSSGGAGAWQYLYAIEQPGAPYGAGTGLVPLVAREDDWSVFWGDPRWQYLKLDAAGAEPAVEGPRQVWAVRRWKASQAAEVTVAGEAALSASAGDGVEVIVAVDGASRSRRRLLPGESWRFRERVPIRPGSTVDIAVTPGPALDTNFDATRVKASITTAAPGAEPDR